MVHGKGKYRKTDNTKIGKERGNSYEKNELIRFDNHR
jgi:hypothetical protein